MNAVSSPAQFTVTSLATSLNVKEEMILYFLRVIRRPIPPVSGELGQGDVEAILRSREDFYYRKVLDRYFGVVKYFDRVVNNFGLLTEIKFSRSDTPRTWKVYAANVRNKEFADGSLVTFSAKEGRLGSIGDVERVIRHTDNELIGMLQVALERDDRYLLTVYNNVNKRKALLSNRLRERLITFLFGRLENATSPTAAHFNNIFIISSASGYSLPSGLIDRLYQMLDKASAAVIREVAPRTKQFANQLNALQLRSLSYLLIDKLIDPSFINTLPYPRPSVQEEMHAVLILLHSIAAPEEAFHFFTKICLEKLQSAHIAAFLVHKLNVNL